MNAASLNPHALIIGLTGGIGSGKTAVSDIFASLGADVVDADVVSREIVQKGQPALQQLAALAGNEVLQPDGSLDRGRLRERLFRDEALKRDVERLLHPLIRQRIRQLVAASGKELIILVAPLLLENKGYDFVDRVLVVDAAPALQRSRTAARDNTSEQEVERIMRSQLAREVRLQQADDVIVNDGDLAQLRQRVVELHHSYRALARAKRHE